MKKILLIPILAAGSIAATVTPLVTSCGSGWIGWDYTKGDYKNDKITPLAYDSSADPKEKAFEWFAQDKNNIAYDMLFSANTGEIPDIITVTKNTQTLKIKIDSYNKDTHFISFRAKSKVDVIMESPAISTTAVEKGEIDVTCKNIKLDVNIHESEPINAGTWYLSTLADPMITLDPETLKSSLASDDVGDWSITGSINLYTKITMYGEVNEESYKDTNCNYNKKTLNTVWSDETNKRKCLLSVYNSLTHPLYYLSNFKDQ